MTYSPYDEQGRIEIPGMPGWRYLPFDADGGTRTITVEREGDGCRLTFTLPDIVQRGEEIGSVAAIVIAAQERADRSEGLGA